MTSWDSGWGGPAQQSAILPASFPARIWRALEDDAEQFLQEIFQRHQREHEMMDAFIPASAVVNGAGDSGGRAQG